MESKEIIINNNSKKLECKSIKSSSKDKILHPFIVSNINTTSIISPTDNNKINEERTEKEIIKEKIIEKEESQNDIIKSIDEIDSPSLNNILAYERIERNKHSNSNDHISLSINKLSTGDDMDILNELMSLCDFLSLSSERIGLNPNIAKLLEEICKNLTKTYLPELIIYSLQCINYILDINPTLTYTLKKINGVASIMSTISCIEDITCVDYIIKIFDKISVQNSKILLENNVFESLLVTIFDFMTIYQKKSIMKICYNISTRRVNINEYNSYIKPAMNVLINLIRIDDNDNIDNLFIVEKATNIFYNIINYIKYGDLFYGKEKKEDNIIEELITKYNIIENYMDILNKYFVKNVQIITEQLIKIILKTIVLILEVSKEGMDKILSNNFLDIISELINSEYFSDTKPNNNNNNNVIINKRAYVNISNKRGIFMFEFFDILIALFPSWKYNNEKNKKILNIENKKYYDYFCQNIFLPLINIITNKSTNKILVKLIKLILAFINNTNKNDIIEYLPSKPISQIIIKLLDAKNNSSVIDATSLVKSLLEKAPENYIVNFVREGIVHNLKNYKFETKKIEIKNDIININDIDKNISKLCFPPLPISKSGRKIPPNDNTDKEKDKNKIEKEIIINKEQIKENKDFEFEFLDYEKKEKNNESQSQILYKKLEFINDDELSKKDEKEKDKNIEENIISVKKIENNFSQKDKLSKFGLMNDSYSEENSFIIDSEENQEEENQDEEDMENNEDEEDIDKQESENNEKEEIEDDLFLIKKKTILNSPFIEDKDKEKDEDSKKEMENEKDSKHNTQKETKIKKFIILDEEANNNKNEKNEDIIIKDLLIKEKEKDINEEKIIETKITMNKTDNKIDDIKNEEKTKNDSKKNKYNEESQRGLIKRKKIQDLIKNQMKYNELEDNLYNIEKKTIELKIKDLLTNYLTDEKILQYLSSTGNKTKDSLIQIRTTLSNYEQLLSSEVDENNDKEKFITEIINILTDEDISITLFELENSKILLSLCKYFDNEFNTQYNKLIDDNENNSIDKLMNQLSDKNLIPEIIVYNKKIYEKMLNFFKSFNGDKNKIINFIKLLNESIQRMNCPIFALNENKRNFIHKLTMKSIKRNSTIKLKVDYNEQIFKDDVLNGFIFVNNNYKTKLCELNTFYATNKRMILIINENTTFKSMTVNLLSTANIPLIANDKYDIFIKYFVHISKRKFKNDKKEKDKNNKMDIEENINNDNTSNKDINIDESEKEEFIHLSEIETNKTEKDNEIFNIEDNWTYKTFLENYSKKYNIEIPINIQFGLSIKSKDNEFTNDNDNNTEGFTNNNNNKSNGFIDYYSKFAEEVINFVDYVNFDKFSFLKDYHNNILYNKSIYFSKRLMPSLYLLSLLNICINKYNELFELPKIWFINSDKNKNEWKKLFFNLKIDQFIFKISLDPYKVSNTSFPFLGKNIINNNQSLTKFITRLLSFKTSFSSSYKSLINLQNHLKHNNPNYNSKYSVTLKKNMRIKVNVEREKIIENGFNIINDEITSRFRGYLEFEYKGEIGNGLGPTLEFYTLIIEKIKEENLWYKTTDGSLFPKLLNDNENNEEVLKLFKLLGFIIGRAIFDDRLLDIPLSKVFWNLALDKPILFKNIKIVDSNLYKTLNDFINLINEKKTYIKKNNIEQIDKINFDDIILYNNCKLSELDIYFIFPGYNNIELKENGNDILLTMNNIEEYVNLIYDYLFFKGIDKIIKSFREGFNINFNIEKLKCFSSSEIEEYICGSVDTKWDKNILFDNLKPEHGYTNQSKTFNDLIKFMSSLDKNQRKKFLTFSTGCSRLPIGGFKSLSPKLTVVKKYCEEENDPDDYLPTVMTCQNYLKIPEYSSYNILEKKILMAMNEGCNEFNLS